jgi:hypothetical protein
MFGPGGSAAGPKPGRDSFSVELGRFAMAMQLETQGGVLDLANRSCRPV